MNTPDLIVHRVNVGGLFWGRRSGKIKRFLLHVCNSVTNGAADKWLGLLARLAICAIQKWNTTSNEHKVKQLHI